MADEQKPQSWWQTVPGILTATAGIITAVAGLILALHQVGIIGTATKQTIPPQDNTPATPKTVQRREATIQPRGVQGPAADVAVPGEAGVILHNNTQATIVHVYFGTAQWHGWSGEQLSEPIPPGGTYTWPRLQPGAGIYDLKAEDSNHQVLDQQMGVSISGTYDWYVGGH